MIDVASDVPIRWGGWKMPVPTDIMHGQPLACEENDSTKLLSSFYLKYITRSSINNLNLLI